MNTRQAAGKPYSDIESPHESSEMGKFFGTVASLVFLAATGVHIGTFVPGSHVSMQNTAPLYFAVFFVGLFAAGIYYGFVPHPPRRPGESVGEHGEAIQEAQRRYYAKLFPQKGFTSWDVFAWIVGWYAVANFLIFFCYTLPITMEGGGPEIESGKYVLVDHGRTIREISGDEYERIMRLVARPFASIAMAVAIYAAVFFYRTFPRMRELELLNLKRDTPKENTE